MPVTPDAAELGLSQDDLVGAREARETSRLAAAQERRTIELDGAKFVIDDEHLSGLVDAARRSMTSAFLETRAEPLALQALANTPRGVKKPPGGGGGYTARSRVPEERREGIGLVGEVAALEWVKAQFPGTSDDAWVSGYRNRVIGDGLGDDTLGYDLSVPWEKKILFFEVKATTGDEFEFELSESEIRAAQSLRRNERYHVLFVQRVLDSPNRRISMLPNPLAPSSLGRYRAVGAGLRFRFEPVESDDPAVAPHDATAG